MQSRGIVTAAIVFFLVVNLMQLWEGLLGGFAFLMFLGLLVAWLGLLAVLGWQLMISSRERFSDRSRIIANCVIAAVLLATFLFPHGVVDFEQFRSKAVLVAYREGVANCGTTLKLREDKTFSYRVVCFGVDESTGTYNLSADSIKLNFDAQYSSPWTVGVVDREKKEGGKRFLRLYNGSDSLYLEVMFDESNSGSNPG